MGAITDETNKVVDLEDIAKNDVFRVEVRLRDGGVEVIKVRVEDIKSIDVRGYDDEPTQDEIDKLKEEAEKTYGKK